MKFLYCDFEFAGINERDLDLVSVSVRAFDTGVMTYEREYWLYRNKKQQEKAREFFKMMAKKGYTFVAFVMEAEARSLLTLFPEGIPKFNAIDLYLEYRNLLNHHDEYCYGEQYIDGQVITTTRPPNKWQREEIEANGKKLKEYKFNTPEEDEEDDKHHKPSYSLAAAVFKLVGEKIDTKEKNEVRDIIIKGTPEQIEANRERIQAYNTSDIKYLQVLVTKIFNILRRKGGETVEGWLADAYTRGDYAIRTAKMLRLGYPVNMEKVKRFTDNVEGILNEAIEDCLEHSAEVESFRINKKEGRYSAHQGNISKWIEEQNIPTWRRTKTKQLSLSKDAFRDWYSSDSPGFAGAFCRYLKTKQSLNGFAPAKTPSKKGKFTDFIGGDLRVRPYFGIYGSQSSRSQPGSTAYLWLKAKWMQNFLEAPPGKALASCDFASQEFLVAGIIAQDSAMIESYASGDVYLAFGKIAGLIPQHGTKETHRTEREICKQCILGMSYGMTSIGLAPRLTAATGKVHTKDDAQKYIDLFEDAYPVYMAWKEETLHRYEDQGYLQLSDGWTIWGDNDNPRSVTNFMVQGEGAVILRESVRLAQQAGLDVLATVHDSIVIECDSRTAPGSTGELQRCMAKGFETVMAKYGKTVPIRLEGECWSRDFTKSQEVGAFKFTQEFIHEKAVKDYERYKKFFDPAIEIKKSAKLQDILDEHAAEAERVKREKLEAKIAAAKLKEEKAAARLQAKIVREEEKHNKVVKPRKKKLQAEGNLDTH